MFLIHYLPMPGLHRWVMWHQTHASESHVECGSEQWHAKAVILVRLWKCLSKKLGYFLVLDISLKSSCWGGKAEHGKGTYTWNENSSFVTVFQKADFDVNILRPSSLPLLADSVILSSLTRSSTLGKGRGWSSLWLHHKLGGNLSGSTFTTSHVPLTW